MTEQTISQQAAVTDPAAGIMRRNIQMKMFATPKDHAEVAHTQETKVLGQLVGVVYEVKEKVGRLPNGDEKVSLIAIGDFEGTNYHTGEVFESNTAYLPAYFVEALQSFLEKAQSGAAEFAIEILLQPSGRPIPTQYLVRNLIARRAESPINRMKLEMAKAGRLRLPPPVDAGVIEGEVLVVTHVPPQPDDAEDAADDAEVVVADPPAIEPAKGKVEQPA